MGAVPTLNSVGALRRDAAIYLAYLDGFVVG